MRQRDIFLFWFPLFASWLLMASEGPIITAAINRLPDEVVMLAAQGIVLSLSVTIESPIINLLSTSTALARDRASYLLIRRFTIHWMVALTLLAALVAYTRLFNIVVIRLMSVPLNIAEWVRPGMRIMVFWSAAIAWRRFLQGVLIRFNLTRRVAWGTVVRLASSGGTVIGLAFWGRWSGVVIGAASLMVGVTAEAIYVTLAARPVIRAMPDRRHSLGDADELTYRGLFWFHLPLAATSLLILLAQPLVTFSLVRLANPTQSLAAWPVVFQIMLIARAAALALPETIIALGEDETSFKPLRRFALNLVAANSMLLALFVFSPALGFYLFSIQDMTAGVGELARSGLALFVPLPGLAMMISWLRGLLIIDRSTAEVNAGMAINLALTALILFVSIGFQWPGIRAAAIALTLAALAEFLFLYWRFNQRTHIPHTLLDIKRPRPAS